MDNVTPPRGTSRDAFGREIRIFQLGAHWFEFLVGGEEDEALRPLVMLQSLEYPGWPSPDFCSLARAYGYLVIGVRRPGYGKCPPLADIDGQVGLIGEFLNGLGHDSAVLVCMGTSNTFGYRLAANPKVCLTVLANCCFNHDPMGEIRPDWFARHIEQTLTSVTGARLALMGLKGAQGIFGKYWVTENFMQKSPGDLAYLDANRELFAEAVDCLHEDLDIHTFIMELRGTLKEDAFLQDGCFNYRQVLSVSGEETSDRWKAAIRAEAARVGVPLHFLPAGDALVVYASARQFLDVIGQYL